MIVLPRASGLSPMRRKAFRYQKTINVGLMVLLELIPGFEPGTSSLPIHFVRII